MPLTRLKFDIIKGTVLNSFAFQNAIAHKALCQKHFLTYHPPKYPRSLQLQKSLKNTSKVTYKLPEG